MTDRMKWDMPPMPEGLDAVPVQEAEALESLMSLALDGLLDESGTEQFEALLASEAGWSAEWENWLAVDAALRSTPLAEPPAGFLAGVEQRLVQLERRRRLMSGVVVGLTALLLWGSAGVAIFSLGAFVLAYQAAWGNELIHGIALTWGRFAGLAQLVWYGILNLAATPQAVAVGMCYAALAASALGLWLSLLRRTTRVREAINA